MEPQERPQPGTKPRTNRVRPGKGDVKGYNKYVLLGVFKDRSWATALVYRQYQVSMVNMCGPSSTILGKIYQQTALSINSIRTSRGTEPTTPTTLQAGTPHSSARERQDRSRVWLCRQRLRESGGLQSNGGTVSRDTTALSAPQNKNKYTSQLMKCVLFYHKMVMRSSATQQESVENK